MIVVTRENIYGLDVFRFISSKRTPYQLVFDDTVSLKYTEVSLVNLLGQSDSIYCKSLRQAVCSIIFDYIAEKKCTLYFDFKLDGAKGMSLFKKFVRWIKLEPRVIADVEITPYDGSHYIEFRLKLNKVYIKSLNVK
ncbi:hypothetical protein [Pontimicrobium aquaticum]|uniref:Uncharacterized protein n=1 Tax=Pontimicrobium aquaticum TaxID=2565367 RepID=A0A4U0F1R7_9FLAO|nr:hypothetical protein [Pontimicrobium aquaticum]TJY37714.1 hypothetical protein E5167_00215 [Pontimicrobium aquaticum]